MASNTENHVYGVSTHLCAQFPTEEAAYNFAKTEPSTKTYFLGTVDEYLHGYSINNKNNWVVVNTSQQPEPVQNEPPVMPQNEIVNKFLEQEYQSVDRSSFRTPDYTNEAENDEQWMEEIRKNFSTQNAPVKVYTDGSVINHGFDKSNLAAGIGVYWGLDHPLNVSEKLPTDVKWGADVVELLAATRALDIARNYCVKQLIVHTDSHFVYTAYQEYLNKSNVALHWKKTLPYQWRDHVIKFNMALNGLNVDFELVKSHAKVRGNVRADSLARKAAKS